MENPLVRGYKSMTIYTMVEMHPVLVYHRFPRDQFNLEEVQDYRDSAYVREKTGNEVYHIPTDWLRYALKPMESDPWPEVLSAQSVGYYSAVLDTIKKVISHRDLTLDPRSMGLTHKYIYLSPFIEQFLQSSALPPVPLPISEYYGLGGSRYFRIVLECRVPTSQVQKPGCQFREFPQRYYEEQTLWRVPITETTVTAVLVKEFPYRPL